MSSPELTIDGIALDSNRQWKINHIGKIDKHTFKIIVGLFTALATTAAIFRIRNRISTRRKLFLDDILVMFATATLAVQTGILFHMCNKLYMAETMRRDPTVHFTLSEILSLGENRKWSDIYLTSAWATKFAIKFSFLALFRNLIRNLSRPLNRYYWFLVWFTAASWIFVTAVSFVNCPYFHGETLGKCFLGPSKTSNTVLVTLVYFVDIITDIMISSIPIILLRMSTLRCVQRLRIAIFLCLSIVIVMVSLVRLFGGLYHSPLGKLEFSMQWMYTILHVEAAIAVMLGSISALRKVFATLPNDRSRENENRPIILIHYDLLKRTLSWKKSSSIKDDQKSTPQLSDGNRTQPTLRGLRTFIRRHERSAGHTTLNSIASEVEDYHNFKKREGDNNQPRYEADIPSSHQSDTGYPASSNYELDPWISKPVSLARLV
ncbi:hypothetical protein K505DRAFT_418567 [Melanomma pulvis-pyrius CBS 109.77]|uniref:Rhodopsin domain-containing protein n=1 Tax=Melanomma pulvis-pyrius CBS 109.77 TaxID=1314802 RepID=A0A6A6X6X7_9PLEO|nr:hypothetical protein K505DRAFT_418567 [Melanomma pulvis-pyrius CBS 109.77]